MYTICMEYYYVHILIIIFTQGVALVDQIVGYGYAIPNDAGDLYVVVYSHDHSVIVSMKHKTRGNYDIHAHYICWLSPSKQSF